MFGREFEADESYFGGSLFSTFKRKAARQYCLLRLLAWLQCAGCVRLPSLHNKLFQAVCRSLQLHQGH